MSTSENADPTHRLTKNEIVQQYLKSFDFAVKNSVDISYELLCLAENIIDRNGAIVKIHKYIKNPIHALNIERGLFECTMLHITCNRLLNRLCEPVYQHKLAVICDNLDCNNERIKNKTLLPAINSGIISPISVAFLTAAQMHPVKWEKYNEKKMREDDAIYNIDTTDEYECPKCNERKCTVESVQLRSADEPANKFIVCVMCGFTVIH